MNRYAQKVAKLCRDEYLIEHSKTRIKSLTETELQEIEREIGAPFPDDYREFVRDFGGIRLGGNQCRRAALYHLQDWDFGRESIDSCYDSFGILEHLKEAQEDRNIPSELIPIGGDDVFIYLAIKGEHIGSVYQWYPSYFPEILNYYPEAELVARSFDSFLQMLKPLEQAYRAEYVEQERREIAKTVEEFLLIEPRADNRYSEVMAAMNGRFVYATLGEDSKVLSEAELREIEREIGHALPDDYREFLRSFGGYSFIPELEGEYYQRPFPIDAFLGVMPCDYHDLITHYRRLKNYLPPDMLPIADGGAFCLKLAGADAGSVYNGWNSPTEHQIKTHNPHSDDEPTERRTINKFARLAHSFDHFLVGRRFG